MERVPSAELIGVSTHTNHALTFHKRSNDGSSKCNMYTLESALTYGAIYKIKPEHKAFLDKFEGKGYGYTDKQITLSCNKTDITCFTYLAQPSHIAEDLSPYHWYKKLVILGAEYLCFPETYISSIDTVKSIEDPNKDRARENEKLIERIMNYK